ncbi:hypothetical protein C8F01DRAFT_1147815 [Mycena amicta]|nr:hypothetical protein C8F01DRAFT_1147815 [Mycena amicta]
MDSGANTSPLVSPPTLKHADGLYFEDCGLIIQAEDVLFRRPNRPFFRDMLAIPLPPDAERLDGCLIVRIPDSAADMTAFLKALLYPRCVSVDFFSTVSSNPPPAQTFFDLLDLILRLSHKYDVDWLQKRVLSYLAITHPTTHEGWTVLVESMNSFMRDASCELCIAVITLARQLSLDWVLPITFYRLGRFRSPIPIFESTMLMDKLRWVEAVRKLDGEYRSSALEFLWEPRQITGCTNSTGCIQRRTVYRKKIENFRKNTQGGYIMPLEVWSTGWWTAMGQRNIICGVCMAEMRHLKQASDEAFWNDLPEIFGLGDWDTLERRKKETFDDL